jgi:hypothetical protein
MDYRLDIDMKKYEGKYVALKSFTDNTIVAFGDKPEKVLKSAIKTGIKEPVVIYVPARQTTYIYYKSIDFR